MINLLPVDWYLVSPIDYELKQYTILSYLQSVDTDFILKKFSPHLLHMECMVKDMIGFQESLINIRKGFDKQRYFLLFQDNPKLEGEKNEKLEEIEEVVDFSLPLIRNRVDLGYTLLKKSNQIIY